MITAERIRALLQDWPAGVDPRTLAIALGVADVRAVLRVLDGMDDVQRCAPAHGGQCWAWRLSFSLAPKLRRHVQAQIETVRHEKPAAKPIKAGNLLVSDDGLTVRPLSPAAPAHGRVAGTAAPAAVEPTPAAGIGGRGGSAPAAGQRACRFCGCTDDDCSGCIARTGSPCSWVGEDVCSACEPPALARILAELLSYPDGCSVGRIADLCRLSPTQVGDVAAAFPTRLSIGTHASMPFPWIRAIEPPAPVSGA